MQIRMHQYPSIFKIIKIRLKGSRDTTLLLNTQGGHTFNAWMKKWLSRDVAKYLFRFCYCFSQINSLS